MITKTVPCSTRIVISNAMKLGIPLWVWQKTNRNWDINMIRILQWRESHCRIKTSIRRKKEIQNSRTVRVTFRGPSRKVNHLSEVIWDRKIITEFTRCFSSTRRAYPVLTMDIKVSREKDVSRWVDWENFIFVRSNRVKKPDIKMKKVVDRWKRRHLVK